MKFDRSTWISVGLTCLLCATALLWQRSRLHLLKATNAEEPATLNHRISAVPTSSSAAEAASPKIKLSVDEIIGLEIGEAQNPSLIVLEEFADYTLDELFEALEVLSTSGQQTFYQRSCLAIMELSMLDLVRETLLEAVSKHDPERVLEMVDAGKLNAERGREHAFTAIAAKDPDRAQELLRDGGWDPEHIIRAENRLAQALLRSDLPAALEFLRKQEKVGDRLGDDPAYSVVGAIIDDPAQRDALWEALASETNLDVRTVLTDGLVTAEFRRGGLVAARAAVGRANFLGEEERYKLVHNFAANGMSREPDHAYAWLCESGDPDARGKMLAWAIGWWANNDINAAGDWLGKLPPSGEKDAAVVKFIESIARIDKPAATAWVQEIGDGEMRNSAAQFLLQRKE